MTTIADRVVEFLSGLHGIDRLQTGVAEETPRVAVIDFHTAAIIERHPNYPDAEFLKVEYAFGVVAAVHTHKLANALLLRHAQAEAAMNGGDVKDCFEQIDAHFTRKTGFSE